MFTNILPSIALVEELDLSGVLDTSFDIGGLVRMLRSFKDLKIAKIFLRVNEWKSHVAFCCSVLKTLWKHANLRSISLWSSDSDLQLNVRDTLENVPNFADDKSLFGMLLGEIADSVQVFWFRNTSVKMGTEEFFA